MLAAKILGRRRTVEAMHALTDVAEFDADPFVAAEAVRALGRTGHPEALAALCRVAALGSLIPRRAAQEALDGTSARGSGDH
jgi:HEAT repeat protein